MATVLNEVITQATALIAWRSGAYQVAGVGSGAGICSFWRLS